MTRSEALSCVIFLSALASAVCAAQVPVPTSAPIFTIFASNVTMPASGIVSIPFTLTSRNGFVGSVLVQCVAPTVSAGVKAPYCENYGPAQVYPLTADGTATGSYEVVAIKPQDVPAVSSVNLLRHGQGASWAFAAFLMVGIGLQRKRTRRFARVLLAIGVIGLTGMSVSGCGGPPTLTPGAYIFTLNGSSVSPAPGPSASTPFTVTVPAGIVTNSGN